MIITDSELEKQLIGHERLMLKPYFDCCGKGITECHCENRGKLTIGVGRNIQDVGITQAEALVLLRDDIVRVRGELRTAIPFFDGLTKNRQRALMDMCFNLGLPKFLKFRKMLSAISEGDYIKAAGEMVDSEWARQVGARAKNLSEQMRNG